MNAFPSGGEVGAARAGDAGAAGTSAAAASAATAAAAAVAARGPAASTDSPRREEEEVSARNGRAGSGGGLLGSADDAGLSPSRPLVAAVPVAASGVRDLSRGSRSGGAAAESAEGCLETEKGDVAPPPRPPAGEATRDSAGDARPLPSLINSGDNALALSAARTGVPALRRLSPAGASGHGPDRRFSCGAPPGKEPNGCGCCSSGVEARKEGDPPAHRARGERRREDSSLPKWSCRCALSSLAAESPSAPAGDSSQKQPLPPPLPPAAAAGPTLTKADANESLREYVPSNGPDDDAKGDPRLGARPRRVKDVESRADGGEAIIGVIGRKSPEG